MKNSKVKKFFILVIIPAVLLAVWMFNPVTAESSRVCVCHVENEKTGAGHVIEVDKDALNGHLRHGDVQCSIDCNEVIGDRCNISTGEQCDGSTD